MKLRILPGFLPIALWLLIPSDSSAVPDPDDVYWDNSISPSLPGVGGLSGQGQVLASIVYDGKLIVGGNFETAGDVIAKGIAAWDGSSWSALGTGVSFEVEALTVYTYKSYHC